MFNNDAINVVLGLIFVFLIYSLLASILMESIARKMGLRARMLLKAISKILDDSDFTKDNYLFRAVWSLAENKYFDPFRKRGLTALFYSHPNVVNLGKNSFSSKPSYLSDELFAETVIQILRGDQFKGEQNQIELIKTNLGVGTDTEGLLPLPGYYKITAKSEKHYGLIKAEELKGAKSKVIELHEHTLYQLKQALFDSHQDIDWFRVRLKKWYNETVERAEGWYIRQTRTTLFYLGFLIALAFNVDCIEIGKRLSADKELRNKIVEWSQHFDSSANPTIKANAETAIGNALTDANKLKTVLAIETRKWDASNFLGWLLTAIALSLGASFWFDLLKKIMAIRTAGEKPGEKKTKTELLIEDAIG